MNTTTTTERSAPLITKSQFLTGVQCQKLLWTTSNAKHLIPRPNAAAQAIFDQGHEVGELAKKLFTNSIEIGQGTDDLEEMVQQTGEAVKARRSVFEAAFSHQSCYAQADIVVPTDDAAWDLIEIKSSTSIKDVYILDLAFQAFVIAGAGLKVGRCVLMLINPDYVRHGEVDPSKFFVRHDVTDAVLAESRQIEPRLGEMFATIRLKNQPDVRIGRHCDAPYTCPLHDQCWSFLPQDNVLELYRGAKKGFKLLAGGINQIKNIPDDFPLTENQEIQRRVAISGQPHVSKAAISGFLRRLEYPVAYLDFETFATAIPLFDHARPFEQITFQFSLHIVASPGSHPEHHMFLADGRADPRLDFLQRLRECLPDCGSIVAYNAGFEQSRLGECCELHPEFQRWLADVDARFLDLLQPFRAFHYYGIGQDGSASIKKVLPALTGRNYDELAIRNGTIASSEFLQVHDTPVSEEERQRVRRELEIYCAQDTEGMIRIVEALQKLTLSIHDR